jgi:hypothetical protein
MKGGIGMLNITSFMKNWRIDSQRANERKALIEFTEKYPELDGRRHFDDLTLEQQEKAIRKMQALIEQAFSMNPESFGNRIAYQNINNKEYLVEQCKMKTYLQDGSLVLI